MKKTLTFLCLVCSLFACRDQSRHPSVSFYFWRTKFDLSPTETEALAFNHVNKLYVRYFDLEIKNGEAVPVAPVSFTVTPKNVSIIPVIYIKNEVMLNPDLNADTLVAKVLTLIDQINKAHALHCSEIQFDCDWTLKSRDRYFKFLKCTRKITEKKLSATIRLHQVKYLEQTGVPDVDYGTLMYYNMGKISAAPSNSIYEREIAQRYLQNLKTYPLALNFALPIYSWGIHARNHKVIGLLNKENEATLIKDDRFKQDGHFFKALKEGFAFGRYFQKGDLVKIESISEKDLFEMAADLREHSIKMPNEIVFYDLDSINLKTYEKDIFSKTSAAF